MTWEQYEEERKKLKEESDSIKKKRKKAAIMRTEEMNRVAENRNLSRELREQTGYGKGRKTPAQIKKH